MARQKLNQGTFPTGAGGDNWRTGSAKLDEGIGELYSQFGANNQGVLPSALPINKGGTGATTAANARTNLDVFSKSEVAKAIEAINIPEVPDASTSRKGIVQLANALNDASVNKALTAAMGKKLQDEKLGKAENAVSASKLENAVDINGASFDGASNVDIFTVITTALDWDTLVNPRNYSVRATAGSNRPTTNHGTLVVSGEGSCCTQTFTADTAPPQTYVRICKDRVWGAWGQVAYNTSNVASASKLETARTIGGVGFDGTTSINLPGVNATGNQSTSGNAATATKLQTARKITLSGAVSGNATFDGSSDVTISTMLTDFDPMLYAPIPYPKTVAPTGYLVMMGQAITNAAYPILYSLYGSRLPDMRAQSIRGLDGGRGIDVGRSILTEQGDAIRNITGTVEASNGNKRGNEAVGTGTGALRTFTSRIGNNASVSEGVSWGFTLDASLEVPTASENRVKNIAFNYIVKAG